MPSKEETWVRRAREGDDNAFTALVDTHAASLYRFLHRRIGNAADAEDLVQQTFVKAHRALPRFDPSKPIAPWLFTIARNLAATHYRSRRPVPDVEIEYDSRTPLVDLQEVEAGRVLWEWAQHHLPDTQFAALWLRVEEDLDVATIAQRLQKSQSNVKVLLHRARKRLAATYNKTGDPVAMVRIPKEARA
jgi:RNA polymerase sigma-70 factor, ECF subfamily